jgi:2-polyprenyl-3-methyl-5-hydroxy-6-metoxy-1,4-benzoquinol methylase
MIGQTNLSNRNSWIAEQLKSIPSGKRILDAGAGELQWKPYCGHLDYVSQDFCQYKGGGDGKGLQCKTWDVSKIDIVSDITDIPEVHGHFDVILCSEVLDHVPDPVEAINELDRVLTRGGTMILTESFCGLTNQAPYFFQTGLSEYWYKEHLKDYDVQIQYNGNYYEWMAQEVHRLASWRKISEMTKAMILRDLEIASSEDKTSHEILCFGLLVKAIKL